MSHLCACVTRSSCPLGLSPITAAPHSCDHVQGRDAWKKKSRAVGVRSMVGEGAGGTRQPSRPLHRNPTVGDSARKVRATARPAHPLPIVPKSDFILNSRDCTQVPSLWSKAPQTGRPKPWKSYCLTVLEAHSPKARCQWGWWLLRAVGENVLCAGPIAPGALLAVTVYPAVSHPPLNLCFHFTWPSPPAHVSASEFSLLLGHHHIGIGAFLLI